MTRTLYLIRHATPGIAPGICYGQLDIGVAGGFEEEANQVRDWLPTVELIMTSPLVRARKLAEHLAQRNKTELRSDARLMEKHFGAWEGEAWNAIERKEIDAWAADVMGHAPPGGESAQQVMRRVQALLRDVSHLPNKSIAMVTHGGIIRAALAQLGGVPLADTLKWEVAYGTVIALRY